MLFYEGRNQNNLILYRVYSLKNFKTVSMKLYFNYKIGTLLLFFLLSSISTMQAAHGKTAPNQVGIHQTLKKPKPKNHFLKRLITKKNNRIATNRQSISRGAIIALIAGSIALCCLFAPLLAAIGTGIWILGGALAIVGDIFGIITLIKIKNTDNPRKYTREKTMAVTGLVLSLLVGIIPLALLVLVLLTI